MDDLGGALRWRISVENFGGGFQRNTSVKDFGGGFKWRTSVEHFGGGFRWRFSVEVFCGGFRWRISVEDFGGCRKVCYRECRKVFPADSPPLQDIIARSCRKDAARFCRKLHCKVSVNRKTWGRSDTSLLRYTTHIHAYIYIYLPATVPSGTLA